MALQFTKSLTINHNLTFMTKPGRSTTEVTCPEYGSLFKLKYFKVHCFVLELMSLELEISSFQISQSLIARTPKELLFLDLHLLLLVSLIA